MKVGDLHAHVKDLESPFFGWGGKVLAKHPEDEKTYFTIEASYMGWNQGVLRLTFEESQLESLPCVSFCNH